MKPTHHRSTFNGCLLGVFIFAMVFVMVFLFFGFMGAVAQGLLFVYTTFLPTDTGFQKLCLYAFGTFAHLISAIFIIFSGYLLSHTTSRI